MYTKRNFEIIKTFERKPDAKHSSTVIMNYVKFKHDDLVSELHSNKT